MRDDGMDEQRRVAREGDCSLLLTVNYLEMEKDIKLKNLHTVIET